MCARAFERSPIRPEVVKPEASRSRPDLLHSHLGHYPRNGFDCRISQRQQQQQKSVGIKLFCIFWRQRTKISARFSELPESTLSKSYQKIQTVIKSAIFAPKNRVGKFIFKFLATLKSQQCRMSHQKG